MRREAARRVRAPQRIVACEKCGPASSGYDEGMKRSILAASMIAGMVAASALAAGLGDTRTVYLLPMTGGLDQYLAVGLTTGLVLQVVTDPQKADAIFTDRLGEGFEAKLDELYGARKKADAKGDGKTDGKSDDTQNFARVQGGSRGRGAVFVVDRKTREVVWSVYDQPKDGTPASVKRSADRIVEKLAKAVKPR